MPKCWHRVVHIELRNYAETSGHLTSYGTVLWEVAVFHYSARFGVSLT